MTRRRKKLLVALALVLLAAGGVAWYCRATAAESVRCNPSLALGRPLSNLPPTPH